MAGESKYSIKKLFIFSINTILCFSNMPLKLGIYAGVFSAALGVLVMVYTLCTRQGAPSGYATIVVLLCFMFAMMFLLIGIIGEYIAILFTELKDRPVYIVEKQKIYKKRCIFHPLYGAVIKSLRCPLYGTSTNIRRKMFAKYIEIYTTLDMENALG